VKKAKGEGIRAPAAPNPDKFGQQEEKKKKKKKKKSKKKKTYYRTNGGKKKTKDLRTTLQTLLLGPEEGRGLREVEGISPKLGRKATTDTRTCHSTTLSEKGNRNNRPSDDEIAAANPILKAARQEKKPPWALQYLSEERSDKKNHIWETSSKIKKESTHRLD